MDPKERIIVALDVSDVKEASALVRQLAPFVGCFKVGLELISNIGGPAAIALVQKEGGEVFYDGKFHDIPNTVGAAAKSVAAQGVAMFNVHASSGIAAMAAAVQSAGEAMVLAVTVLTSLGEEDAYDIYSVPSKVKVLRFVRDAVLAGCDGIICSPKELELVRGYPEFRNLVWVTPGVRPPWADANDQKRIMTPAEAVRAGATHLVIGRPITRPSSEIGSPAEAAMRIAAEIAEVL